MTSDVSGGKAKRHTLATTFTQRKAFSRMPQIRQLFDADWPKTWEMIEPVFRAGDTFPYPSDLTMDDAFDIWVSDPAKTFLAVDGAGSVVGTYYLKANQPGQGSHVCTCGYIVSPAARGVGVASAMCQHSQREAIAEGYRAMQYNLVVATNTNALRLWQKLGFDIVGTLPGAFDHPKLGYVDAHVMYKQLV